MLEFDHGSLVAGGRPEGKGSIRATWPAARCEIHYPREGITRELRPMPHDVDYFDLRCPACGWSELCGPEGMTRWLLKARKLRPRSAPDPDILVEVFRAAAPHLSCPRCGRTGLAATVAEEDEDWPGDRRCAACHRPITAERLRALPGAKFCAACQKAKEGGQATGETEYCPRCGAPMALRLSKTPGVTRYVMACTATPPCRGRR